MGLIDKEALLNKFNNTGANITFDLPVEELLGEDVDIDDFTMLVQDAIQVYRKMVMDTINNQPTAYDIDNVIEELEEYKSFVIRNGIMGIEAAKKAIEIVKQEAEQYNNGWIPCSERLPEECVPVNVTWINRKPESYYAKIKDVPFSATAVYYNSKWYWYSSTCIDYLSEYGKNDFDLIDKDIDIIAWQPLPKPFQKGE